MTRTTTNNTATVTAAAKPAPKAAANRASKVTAITPSSSATTGSAPAKGAPTHGTWQKPASSGYQPPKPKDPPVYSRGKVAPDTVDPTLATILSWRRPYNTKAEQRFVEWLAQEIVAKGYTVEWFTHEDNLVVTVPRKDGKASTTLFSSHTDTVHSGPILEERQALSYDANVGHIFLSERTTGDCLGADDGAGIWLMLKMIDAKVPGTYVFHRGEERGCIGSRAMVETESAWLAQFDIAVAFDRKGTTEIITHQGGMRCASDKCATALATALNKGGAVYLQPSNKGMYTDTKHYRDIIPECFNMSVGYYLNHGPSETQDYRFLVNLADALIAVDWDALPVDRDPTPQESDLWGGYGFPTSTGSVYKPAMPAKPAVPATTVGKPAVPPTKSEVIALDVVDEVMNMTFSEICDWTCDDPEGAARVLVDLVLELEAARTKITRYQTLAGM